MEIITLSYFNLELAIDYAWNTWKQKQENILKAQIAAQQEAEKWLTSQFQSDLDDCLDRQFQSALNIEVLPVSEISIFSVTAHFQYQTIQFYLRRISCFDTLQWELNYLSKSVVCLPEYLKNQILIELGQLKNKTALTVVTKNDIGN
jgi:hypothetical protein